MKTNPMLLIDFYKAVHRDMLPKNMTKSVSYFTPRMSRVKMWDEVVFFGLQMFITDYLINHFHEHFFSRPRNLVVFEYKYLMNVDPTNQTAFDTQLLHQTLYANKTQYIVQEEKIL